MSALRQLSLELFPQPKKSGPKTHTHAPANLATIATAMKAEAAAAARALGLHRLSTALDIQWNSRLQTTAGRASSPLYRIELNPRLIEVGIKEIRRTMLHELAHLVAKERAGRRNIQAHGPEWRQACKDLGIPGESRTHSLDWASRRQRRKFLYTCPQCLKSIERVRPFRRVVACAACCKQFANGTYDERFRFIKTKL